MDEIPPSMRAFCSPANSQWLVSAIDRECMDRKQTAMVLILCGNKLQTFQLLVPLQIVFNIIYFLIIMVNIIFSSRVTDVWAKDEIHHPCFCTYSECVCTYCKDKYCWGQCHCGCLRELIDWLLS